MQRVGLGCKILEEMVNIVPLYDDVLPSAHLDPYGFKMNIDGRFFLGDLQGVASQHPMRCKGRNLLLENGSIIWEGTNTIKK